MSTRSSRRASTAPVSPIPQAVTANVTQAKGTPKRSSRKVLADKTNATPVAKLVPTKSPRKAPTVAATPATIKVVEEVVCPCINLQTFEHQPATPVVVRGEDLLRSLVHSNLTIIQTPSGPVRQSPEAETPQFGVPATPSPVQDTRKEHEEVALDVEVSTPPQQGEVVDAVPPVDASPAREVTASVSESLSSAWVGCDVDDVTEFGEDDDSDCSVLVNVSSPGMHLVASPAPASSVRPATPRSADFKWKRRDQLSLKVKEQGNESFNYYGGDEEYEGCDEFDGADDYDGEVIDCEEICQAISRMGVEAGLPEHKGRHIRFNYNSDDEIDVEEVEVMRLRGVPTPRGKHLRFPEDQEVPMDSCVEKAQ